MEVARAARMAYGLSPHIPFGAYVPLVVHDDPQEAARIGTFQVSLFARFPRCTAASSGPASTAQREVMQNIHNAYDMQHHGLAGAPQDAVVTTDFRPQLRYFRPRQPTAPTAWRS